MAKVITPEFRGSFVNVMEAKAYSADQDPKYSMTIAIPKDDKFWKELNAEIKAVCIKKWNEVPKKYKTFFKDGDEEEEKYGFKGMTVFTASNKQKPGIVVKNDKGDLVEPMNNDEIYSGAYYRASLRPYAYEYQNSKGVAISLDNVMKTKEGERFGSKTSAAEDFSDFAEGDWD